MTIFIIIFILLSIYFIVFFRAVSPYRIYVVFGKQGSGKSTYFVKQMLWYMKHGWNVYTDMPDVSIPGLRHIKTFDLAEYAPSEKSVVFLDEAGLSFDARNFKRFPEGMRDFAALHRHYKVTIWLSSQTYDLDKKFRDRAHKLFLVQNLGRLSLIRPIRRDITLTDANSQAESRVADQLRFEFISTWRFTWLPRYYKYFNSFTRPYREPVPYTVPLPALEKESRVRHNRLRLKKK